MELCFSSLSCNSHCLRIISEKRGEGNRDVIIIMLCKSQVSFQNFVVTFYVHCHLWAQSVISLLSINMGRNLSDSNTDITPSQKLEVLLLNRSNIFRIPGYAFIRRLLVTWFQYGIGLAKTGGHSFSSKWEHYCFNMIDTWERKCVRTMKTSEGENEAWQNKLELGEFL